MGDTDPGTIDALTTELAETRSDIRRSIGYQGQVLTSGLAANGVILGYSFVEAGGAGSTPHVLIAVVPIVIGVVTILAFQEATNYLVLSSYLAGIERELADRASIDGFGFHSQFAPAFGTRRKGLEEAWLVDWVGVPLLTLYLVAGIAFFLTWGIVLTTPFGVAGSWGSAWKGIVSGVYAVLVLVNVVNWRAHATIEADLPATGCGDGEHPGAG